MHVSTGSKLRSRGQTTATVVTGLGILTVLAGAVALAFPVATGVGVTVVVGAFLAITGVVHIVDGLRGPGRHLLESLVGLLYLAMGALIFIQPWVAALSLVLLLAFLLWFGGALRMAAAFTGEAQHRGLAALGGLCAFVLGFLVLRANPTQAVWTLGLFVGIELLFSGLSMIRFSRTVIAPVTNLRKPLTH